MTRWAKALAAVLVVIGAALLIYTLLTPEDTETDGGHMGMHANYSGADVTLLLIATVIIVAGIAFALAYQEYEPVPPNWAPASTSSQAQPRPEREPVQPEPEGKPPKPPAGDLAKEEENYLVLRLLSGDERLMFKAIMDSGGEALQKDLILKTRMSNAKVSRLLDKLAQKGVITKEKYGATNKIKIQLIS